MSVRKISKNGVHFAHHIDPTPYNVGDDFCAPYHYFTFQVDEGSDLADQCLVIGGGTIPDAEAIFDDQPFSIRILWAVGNSVPFHKDGNNIRGLISKAKKKVQKKTRTAFLRKEKNQVFLTTRDPSAETRDRSLLPCVSCLHEICDQSNGDGIAVIINENPKVSGSISQLRHAMNEQYPNIRFETNAISMLQLVSLFSETDRIVTNSYHIAYWGLLSGKNIQFIGYSSKSEELMSLFGFGKVLRERSPRGDAQKLLKALVESIERPAWIKLDDPQKKKEEFRELNRDYAQRISDSVSGLRVVARDVVEE